MTGVEEKRDRGVFTLTKRYNWFGSSHTCDLAQSPCICCGDSGHSVIRFYRDENYHFRRGYNCPVVTGTDPDPFYEKAYTEMYLGLSLNPEVFAEIYHYDKERIREFFGKENSFIVHPIRVKAFCKMILDHCDEVRNSWTFKREIPRSQDDDSDTEMDTDEDSMSSETSPADDIMDC